VTLTIEHVAQRNFSPARSQFEDGYREYVAIVTTMQAPPLYHTSGEVLEAISEPGLERMARFLAFFIKELDKAPRELIAP